MTNYLIRHGSPKYGSSPYEDYLYGGLGQREFDLSESSRQELLEKNIQLTFRRIYCSPAKVCLQTAEIINTKLKVEILVMQDLWYILHDFSTFTNSELWVNGQAPSDSAEMISLRSKSIAYFLDDLLIDKKEKILGRFYRVKEILENTDNVLFITHGYTLKLLYLYLKTEFNINKEELLSLAQVEKSFGESLQGFTYPDLKAFSM